MGKVGEPPKEEEGVNTAEGGNTDDWKSHKESHSKLFTKPLYNAYNSVYNTQRFSTFFHPG